LIKVLLALADWGYMINLFNLLPIGSMDGGRVAATLSPWLPAGGLSLGGEGGVVGVAHMGYKPYFDSFSLRLCFCFACVRVFVVLFVFCTPSFHG
jgi:hypothetical protein